MTISDKQVVEFNYTLTNAAGEVLDASKGEPLGYLQGAGNIIPGLEAEMLGKAVGDSFKAEIQPEDGYGPVYPEMVQEVPREAFQGVDSIEAGMQFQAETDGGPRSVVVTAVTDTTVTVDGNHPLAGEVLTFDVEVMTVREATEQELEHGHIHDGGHDH